MRLFCAAVLVSASSFGAEMTGYISDAACGWNNARPGAEARECARRCVKGGWDPVLIVDGKTESLKIAQKDKALPFVGEHVAIQGKVTGGAVSIVSIRKKPV